MTVSEAEPLACVAVGVGVAVAVGCKTVYYRPRYMHNVCSCDIHVTDEIACGKPTIVIIVTSLNTCCSSVIYYCTDIITIEPAAVVKLPLLVDQKTKLARWMRYFY